MSNPALLPLLATLVIAPIAIIAILVFSPKQTKRQADTNKYAKINKQHRKFSTWALTRKDYLRLVEMLSRLSIYNFQEVRFKAVRYFKASMICMIGVWLVGTIIFKDIISSLLLLLFAYMVKNKYIDQNVEKARRQLLNEFSSTLSSLREEYTRLGNIPDAIAECEKGKLLQSQMEDIYSICTAVDGEDRLNEFYAKCQFRQLKTLAAVCYILNDTGDVVDARGQSSFKVDIGLIKDEVDLEVRKNTMIHIKFNMLEYLPIVPLFCVSIVQNFFMNNIPGTSVMYNGLLGFISRFSIVILAIIGFYVITNINSEQYVRSNDRMDIVDNLLQKRWYKRIVQNVATKKGKVILKINNKIRGCLSSKDVEYIYGEKVLFSTICFVFALIASVIMVISARQFIYNNTKSLSLVGGTTYSLEEYDRLFEYDCSVMEKTSLETDDVMSSQLSSVLPNATEFTRLEEVSRIKLKYEKYHNTYYRWWYVLICYGIGMAGWFIPEFLLKFRAYMVKAEAEEDVLQMQTIIAAVMETSLDTMSVLYWMEKNSSVHQHALRYCYHEYASDPELALNRLKSKSTVAEFHHMCDKLITTIHQISVKEAFADLVPERAHIMRIREMVQEQTINSKRMIASPLALAPIFALAGLHILAPVGILGFAEFTKAFAQAGF